MKSGEQNHKMKFYLYESMDYFHSPEKTRKLSGKEKQKIYTKILVYMQCHNKVSKCKEFIVKNDITGPDLDKWSEFIDLNVGTMLNLEDDLKKMNVELTEFHKLTGCINPFELVPDILDY